MLIRVPPQLPRCLKRFDLASGLMPSEIMDSASRNIEFWVPRQSKDVMEA